MPGRADSLRYRHALIVFMSVLLAFSLVADALLVGQQRGELLAEARNYAERELRLIGTWARAALQDDYVRMETSILEWARANPSVAALSASRGTQELIRYRRGDPPAYALSVSQQLPVGDGPPIDLSLTRDVTRIEQVLDRMRVQLIVSSIIFIAILGTFLWVTVRRMALLPMRRYESELQMHRYRLERLVQERTSELTNANRNLRREIGEREQAEQGLRLSTERLTVLREIDQAILGARSLQEIAQGALTHISTLLPCRRATVTLFDLERAEAELLAVDTGGPTRLRAGQRFPMDVTAVPESLRQGEPFVVGDLSALDQLSPMEQLLADEGARAYAIVPLTDRGTLLGALHLASAEAETCSAGALDVAVEVADVLAVAIKQARLNEQVQRHADELEQRVEARTGELREAQAELEAFTYSISHDLRGHLWTIQGFTDYLLERYGDRLDEEGSDYLHSIAEAGRSMALLTQDLLTYSHINRAEFEPAPVSLDRAASEAKQAQEKRIAETGAEVTIQQPLGEAVGHHLTLVQVLSNLLDNAMTYVAAGVRPQIRLWSDAHGTRTRLWIEDNGIGIPPEQRERIFHVFERLQPSEKYPGSGIGLAIVQRGVARMGGRVGVESRPEGGSRFWLELDRPAAMP